MFCGCCDVLDHCRNIKTRLVSDSELSNPEFIRDVRDFAFSLDISSYRWREFLTNQLRDYHGWFEGADGKEAHLNMHIFEIESHRAWFRDFCCRPTKDHIKLYVRREARGRAKILATILRASFPDAAVMWGKRAANDNEGEKQCPIEKAMEEAEVFDASPEGQEILRAIEKECSKQKPQKLGNNPFTEGADEDDDLPF